MALLEARNLVVDLLVPGGELHAVRGLDITLEAGRTLCIVGESGCGKSITSLALMGLLPRSARLSADRLVFDDQDLLKLNERRWSSLRGSRMAMIFQEPMTCLNPTLTIGEQLIEAYRQHRRATRSQAVERATYLLERVGITAAGSRLAQYPHQLSGGLRQRIMIAGALMCEPALIVADEPTTALDVTIQAQILRLLKELQRETGVALLLITHDLGVVASVADQVTVMYAGQMVESGPAAAVFGSPAHPYTRGLLACVPWPGRTKRHAHLGSIPGVVPNLVQAIAGCSFADRCRHVMDSCRREAVGLHGNDDHGWRCLLDDNARRPSGLPG
jgi:peptide/nickel transport system ATP-binding protein